MSATSSSQRVAPTRIQQTIARRMAAAHADIPDFTLEIDVDMEHAVQWRAQLPADDHPRPSYNDMVLRACAKALRRNPRVNASWVDGCFELHGAVNIGLAVAAPGLLMVPVVRDADRRSMRDIGAEARRLAEAVRDGSIRGGDLADGTFTVSNLGMLGIDRFSAMVNVPQAAILAVGALVQRPVAVDGAVTIRHVMTLALSCDHRVLYGADGAAFLATIRSELQVPGSLDADVS